MSFVTATSTDDQSSSSCTKSKKKQKCPKKKKCKLVCVTAKGEEFHDLSEGFQALPTALTLAVLGTTFTIPAGTLLPIVGFVVPADCAAVSRAQLTHCGVERVCDPGVVVGARSEVTALLTPVLSGTAFAGSTSTGLAAAGSTLLQVTVLGTPVVKKFINHLTAVFDPKDHELECCPEKCKLKFEVCRCEPCPGPALFEDVNILTTTPIGAPGAITTPAASISVATVFHQFDAAKLCIKKRKKRVPKPHLASVAPACVDLPVTVTSPVIGDIDPVTGLPDPVTVPLPTPETCVTINGCNLNNISAVVFNGRVEAEIIQADPNAIVVRVPAATALLPGFPSPVITPPFSFPPFVVTVNVIDFCGRLSNAVTLQINCPLLSTFSVGSTVSNGCVGCNNGF